MASNLFGEMRGFLKEIGEQKQAAAKKADAASDPGGYQGSSSHPTAKADANLESAVTGARASENEKDVKEQIPANVNSTAGNTGDQDAVQLGTAKATGEDPANEKNYKGDKDDPGTSSPASVEDGKKYGSYAGKPFGELFKLAGERGNKILAAISVSALNKTASPAPAAPASPAAPANQTPVTPSAPSSPVTPPSTPNEKAAAAGSAAAASVSAEKVAEYNAREGVAATVRDAFRAADLTVAFTSRYAQSLGKSAADGTDSSESSSPEPKEKPSEGGGDEGGGSAAPSDGGGGGAPEGGPPAGGGGGGQDPMALIEQLLMALAEAGITPDMLMGGAQGMPGGGGEDPAMAAAGGAPGGAGGMDALLGAGGGGGAPPMMPPPPGGGGGMEIAASTKARLIKLASTAKSVQEKRVADGTFQYQPPKTAQEKTLRDQIKGCCREIIKHRQ